MLTHLTLVLTVTLQAPSMQAAQDAFNDGDYASALETYRKLAQTPGAALPVVRAGEHDSLLELHRVTGDAAHLCDARTLARDVLAGDLLRSDDEQRVWQARAADDAAKLAAASSVAGRDVCAPDEPPPPEVRERPPASAERTEPPRAEGPAPSPPVRPSAPRRPTVRRVGTGLLIAGSGLALGTGALLGARTAANATILALDRTASSEGRPLSPDEHDLAVRSDRRYVNLTGAAIAVGLVGGVSVLAGVVLWALPSHTRAVARWRPSGFAF